MVSCFVLSIEPQTGPSFRHGFHLGTDLRVAREIALEYFVANKAKTVALMRDRKIFDLFDGDTWSRGT